MSHMKIVIPGVPAPKRTPQPIVVGKRIRVGGQTAVLNPHAQARKDDETARYEAMLADAIAARIGNAPAMGPMMVDYLFVLQPPARRPKGAAWCPVKPDVDNLVKACQDAVIAAVGDRWGDDARIVAIRAAKIYDDEDGPGPRTVIGFSPAAVGAPTSVPWVQDLMAFDPLATGWEDL